MAYDKGRLNAKQIEALTKPGHYADGKGLYLQVSKWGTKSWVFKFTLGKRKNKRGELVPNTRGMGLGPIDELTLKKAREEVERLRVMVREGRDPIEERAEQRRALTAKYEEANQTMLFKDAIANRSEVRAERMAGPRQRASCGASRAALDLPGLDGGTGLRPRHGRNGTCT